MRTARPLDSSGLVPEDEAARLLGVAPHTLAKWRRTGQGPTYRKLGRAVRYATADLLVFLEACARVRTRDDEPPEVA